MYLTVNRIGGNICERFINKHGQEERRKVRYKPTLFIQSKNETGYKDIYGRNCAPRQFDSMFDADRWKKETSTFSDVMGMDDYEFAYIADTYPERAPQMHNTRIANIDIEVPAPEFPHATEARYEIKSIVHYDSLDDKYYFFGVPSKDGGKWSARDSILSPELLSKVEYIECPTEEKLLIAYLELWIEKTPVITTGWNIETFDMPYIGRRIEKVLGTIALGQMSPWGQVSFQEKKTGWSTNLTIDIAGVQELDYLALYKKFTFTPRANFRLDYIGECEVKQKKLDFPQATYLDFYKEDWQLFGDYNIRDVELVNKIDGRLMLLQLACTMGYYGGFNYKTCMATLKPWDAIIFNSLKKQKVVVPASKRKDKKSFIGAFVKAPKPGFYENIMSFDLTSLYPSIIRQCNISPETIITQHMTDLRIEDQIEGLVNGTVKLPHGEHSASANGMLYTKDFKGVIPIEIAKVFFERKDWKGKMLAAKVAAEEAHAAGDFEEEARQKKIAVHCDVEQMTRKIQINSLYGALGNAYFRYYDERNAEAVTSFGQLAIKWVARDMNNALNRLCATENVDYVIYGDTDSIYVSFDGLIKKLGKNDLPDNEKVDFLDALGKKLEKSVIDPSYDRLTEYMNNYEKQMFMDREVVALTGFFIAKKRYALNVFDNEGVRYAEPKLKIMGIETQRSSTPVLCQNGLKESIRRILQESEESMQAYVKEFKTNWKKADYKEISYVSSANNIGKYSDENQQPVKGCPGHIKGVLAYNRAADKYGFDKIQEGEKVALVKLREPNRYGVQVMAYPSGTDFPTQIDDVYLKSVIDYNLLYHEKFEGPLDAICSAIGYSPEKQVSLSKWFG